MSKSPETISYWEHQDVTNGDLAARPHSEVRKLARRARWPSRRGRAGRRWYRSGTVIRRPTSCMPTGETGVFAAPTTGVAEQDVDGNKLDEDVCVCTSCGGSSDLVRRGGCDKSYCVACGCISGPVAGGLGKGPPVPGASRQVRVVGVAPLIAPGPSSFICFSAIVSADAAPPAAARPRAPAMPSVGWPNLVR